LQPALNTSVMVVVVEEAILALPPYPLPVKIDVVLR
jgi:hypothetical protein